MRTIMVIAKLKRINLDSIVFDFKGEYKGHTLKAVRVIGDYPDTLQKGKEYICHVDMEGSTFSNNIITGKFVSIKQCNKSINYL